MPSTFTSSLNLEKQATGEADNTWGVALNAVLDDIDDAIASRLSKSVAGASDVTLTAAEALHSTHEYTGTLTGNINVIVPASEKIYLVYNNTSGSFTLTVKTSAGTGISVPQGQKAILVCDATDVENWLTQILGGEFFLDADLDTSITADTDDRIDFKIQGQDVFRFDGTTSTVINGLDFIAAATGNPAQIQAAGDDTDIQVDILSKGAANIQFYAGSLELLKLAYVASAVNFPQLEPSAASNPVKLSGFGDDTDVGIQLVPKGAGAVSLGNGAFDQVKGSDVASATTTDIGAATGNYVDITGTTTITGLGTVQAGTQRIVQFDDVLTLTHNASSLILPTGANITTAAGDTAKFVSLGSGNWKCVWYQRATGAPVAKYWQLVENLGTLSSSAETTAIPSGAIAIKVLLNGVSADQAANTLQIEISDSGTYPSSSSSVVLDSGTAIDTRLDSESGGPLILVGDAEGQGAGQWDAADAVTGIVELWKDDENRWFMTSRVHDTNGERLHQSSGLVTLSGEADRLKITVAAGSIDAGEATVWAYA